MKKHGLMIFVVIQIFLSFLTIAYFSQNSYASSNHPYRFFSERRISQFDQFPVTSEAIVFLGDSLVDEGRWEEIILPYINLEK